MNEYQQKQTIMPHIEIVPREELNEKQCYHLQHLICEVTMKYLNYIGIDHPCVACGTNTGVNSYAPLEFRDECGMSIISLSDLMEGKAD